MGAFCVAFTLFGGMILLALCGMGIEWYCRREEEMEYSKGSLQLEPITESYAGEREQKTAAKAVAL